ncbi:MAG: exo-alpha-sialidase [Candidatus Kerfeldbacteria bacterium]|nr:exo-alpha-sialidase [Candidatus Kerfeldbacteria bacterium]
MTKKILLLGIIVCLAFIVSACTKTTNNNNNTATTNTKTSNQQAADPNQYNWSGMNQGPYRDKISFATGSTLTSWTPSGKILAEHASVPGAVIKDGTIYVYFVDVTTDGVKEQLGMVKSTDNGQTWSERQLLTITGLGDKATADPAPVLLADGRIRLFYFDINESRINRPANGIEPTNKIYSAISYDGVNFTQEDGIRFERRGIFDPDVEKVGDTWYLYGGDVEGNKVIVATSTDGLTFTERGVAFTGGAVPDVWHENDQWYLYTAGISIATSTDGLTFTPAGIRFEDRDLGNITADPSVIKLSEGSYLMLFKSSPGR